MNCKMENDKTVPHEKEYQSEHSDGNDANEILDDLKREIKRLRKLNHIRKEQVERSMNRLAEMEQSIVIPNPCSPSNTKKSSTDKNERPHHILFDDKKDKDRSQEVMQLVNDLYGDSLKNMEVDLRMYKNHQG